MFSNASIHIVRLAFGALKILKWLFKESTTRSITFGYCFLSTRHSLPARTPRLVSTEGKQVCVHNLHPVHRKSVSSISRVQPIFPSMIALTRAFFPRGVAHSLPFTV